MEGRQHPVGMLEEETHGLSFSDLHVSSGKRGSHQSSIDEEARSAHLLCREADPVFFPHRTIHRGVPLCRGAILSPIAENAKIIVINGPYFGTYILFNYLPFSKAAKGAQGGPQQHETPEQKHSPTDISKRLRSSQNNMDCIYMTPLHCLFALSLF